MLTAAKTQQLVGQRYKCLSRSTSTVCYTQVALLCRRPTFLPAMKAKQLDKAKVLADPTRSLLASFIEGMTDLAQPKACLPLLSDHVQLDAFQKAIKGALQELPGKSRYTVTVSTIGSGLPFAIP